MVRNMAKIAGMSVQEYVDGLVKIITSNKQDNGK